MAPSGIALFLALAGTAAAAPEFSDQILLKGGEGGYVVYINPAAVVTRNGTVVVFSEARKGSDSDFASIDLVAQRSRDGGRTWTKAQVVWTEGKAEDMITLGNACPVYDADTGRLWCIFDRKNQEVLVTYSDDDGASWAHPRDITAQVRPYNYTRYWTGPGHGLQLRHGAHKGRMIFPSVHMALEESDGGTVTSSVARSNMIYTDDHGRTWKIGGSTQVAPDINQRRLRFTAPWLPGEGTWQGDECMATELPDGRLYLIIRSSGDYPDANRCKEVTWSEDGGQTWSPVKFQPQLPDPSCQSSILRLGTDGNGPGTILYAGITVDPSGHDAQYAGAAGHDPTRAVTSGHRIMAGVRGRQRLAAYVSSDGCRNWREAGVIHAAAASYSDLAVAADGGILCFYNGGQGYDAAELHVARFNREWLAHNGTMEGDRAEATRPAPSVGDAHGRLGPLDSARDLREASLPPARDIAMVRSGEDGYTQYWNPAAVVTRRGTVIVFEEGRKGAAGDMSAIDLVVQRSEDKGQTWSRPRVVWSEGKIEDQISMGNACPVCDADTGRIWCAFNRENQQVLLTHSDDDGATWAHPVDITSAVRPINWTRYFTGPGHGLQLRHGAHRGRLVLPSLHIAYEVSHNGEKTAMVARSHMVYSDDHGVSWKVGQSTRLDPKIDPRLLRFEGAWVPGEATWEGDECMATELSDGRLYLIIRSSGFYHYDRRKEIAWSADGGETWSPVEFQRQLPEPSCQASIVRLEGGAPGAEVFLYAGVTVDPSRALRHDPLQLPGVPKRQRLAAYISTDGCRNWRETGVIHAAAAAYSDLVALPGGKVLCFFCGGDKDAYESMRVASFDRAWLQIDR